MGGLDEARILTYLRLAAVPGAEGIRRIARQPAGFEGERFVVESPAGRWVLKRYDPAATDAARRETAGLRLGGSLGLAPSLLAADETGTALGGPALVYDHPGDATLAGAPLSDADVRGWLFLLLTLHHLPASAAPVPSSMSPDAATWWRRTQPAWEACRRAYAGPEHARLLDALGRLHTIANVHIEAHRDLWRAVPHRPCHGNPAPAHVVRGPRSLLLTEWDAFGLGDPALEVGRTAAVAAMTGELAGPRYTAFVEQYVAGMRDVGDATLEQRLRVYTSVLPLGYCFTVLALAAQQRGAERAASLEQAARALGWVQQLLGVRAGDPAELLVPLRG